ncbi:MAG: hypothetical protein CMJ81_21025 [Planctomycetaceae bacterium]|nr:hypothetical protein [Planctomycetaceae bacterium]
MMIHHTCDRCKRLLDPTEDLRYVVKMEAFAVMEPVKLGDVEDDRDHLLEVHEILEQLDQQGTSGISEHLFQKLRYDLCSDCHRKFIKDPLGHKSTGQFDFSPN